MAHSKPNRFGRFFKGVAEMAGGVTGTFTTLPIFAVSLAVDSIRDAAKVVGIGEGSDKQALSHKVSDRLDNFFTVADNGVEDLVRSLTNNNKSTNKAFTREAKEGHKSTSKCLSENFSFAAKVKAEKVVTQSKQNEI